MNFLFPYTFHWFATLTFETHSLDFDTVLELMRVREDGSHRRVAEDDDDGIGSNSRLTRAVQAGARYRLEVRPRMADWGGSLELSVTPGEVEFPGRAILQQREQEQLLEASATGKA